MEPVQQRLVERQVNKSPQQRESALQNLIIPEQLRNLEIAYQTWQTLGPFNYKDEAPTIYSPQWVQEVSVNNGYYTGEIDDLRRRHGRGIQYSKLGIFEGWWFENRKHGPGRFIGSRGDYTIAYWVKGYICGFGSYHGIDKSVLVGDWRRDKMNGYGLEQTAAYTYEGKFKDGIAHGKGTCTFRGGEVFKGWFKNGEIHGYGVMKNVDGQAYAGQWKHGEMAGIGARVRSDLMDQKGPDVLFVEEGLKVFKQEEKHQRPVLRNKDKSSSFVVYLQRAVTSADNLPRKKKPSVQILTVIEKRNLKQVKPVLGYWNSRGRGHPCRVLLTHLGIEFIDRKYTPQQNHGKWDVTEWSNQKYFLRLPFPNLPYFKDGLNRITETSAILQSVCSTYAPAYMGRNIRQKLRVIQIGSIIQIYDAKLVPSFYMPNFGVDGRNGMRKFCEENLQQIANFMNQNSLLAGNLPTWPDFWLLELLNMTQLFEPGLYDRVSPKFGEFIKVMHGLEKVSEFLEETRDWKINNVFAHLNNQDLNFQMLLNCLGRQVFIQVMQWQQKLVF